MAPRRLLTVALLLGVPLATWRLMGRHQPDARASDATPESPPTDDAPAPPSQPPPAFRPLPTIAQPPAEPPTPSQVALLEGGRENDRTADATLRHRAAAAYAELLAASGVAAGGDTRLRTILLDAEDNWAAGVRAWSDDRDEALRAIMAGKAREGELAARLDDDTDALFARLARDTQTALVAEIGESHRAQVAAFLDEHLRAVLRTRPFERR